MSVHHARAGRAVIAWDRCARTAGDAAAGPRRSLGSLAFVSGLLHEGIAAHAAGGPFGDRRHPLTDRECECVSLVAA